MSKHQDIEAARKAAMPEAEHLKDYRRYARGDQRNTLNAEQRRVLQGVLGHRHADNVCGRILSELRNRLRLRAFEVAGYQLEDEGIPAAAARVLQYLKSLWTLQSLPPLSSAVHFATLRDGDHAVSLNHVTTPGGEGRVIFRRELWWNGKWGLWIAYDDNGRPEYAVKDWKEAGAEYRTIYYTDRIERYRKGGEGWQPYARENDPEGSGGTVPWTTTGTAEGEPLGLPIVHFKNLQVPQDPAGDDSKTEPDPMYGSSELAGGILGLQDEVNDVQRDITAAARYTAYQIYWGTGLTVEYDEHDNPVHFTVEPGAMLEDPNENASFGSLPPGSIGPLQETLKTKIEAISRGTSVPMHVIQGDWPSGEALIRAEMPLIDKVGTIADSLGPAWASLMHKATRLHNVFGGAGAAGVLDEDLLITTVFGSAERRDEGTQLDIELKEVKLEQERLALERERRALDAAGEIDDIENELEGAV